MVSDLLSDRVHPATLRLVDEALRGRTRDLVATLDWLVDQAAQARGWRVARVRTAREIDGGEREQLAAALERLAGAPVELQVFVDENCSEAPPCRSVICSSTPPSVTDSNNYRSTSSEPRGRTEQHH